MGSEMCIRDRCTSPSDEPVILSDTRDKSNPPATALPRTTTYSPSRSSARTASSRAVEATFCKNRRKTHGRGRRAIAPLVFCFSRTLVLAVPLLVLATLASVRRPDASWRALGGVGAEFAPRNREELQGDGGAEKGVFGCVGECGQGLSSGSGDEYCHGDANGPWESGDGTTCANAGSDVPSGQGDGKYGAIGSWSVSKITSMAYSECTTVHPRVVSSSCLLSRLHLSLSLPFLIPHTHLSSSSSSSSLDVLPLHHQCFLMRNSSPKPSAPPPGRPELMQT